MDNSYNLIDEEWIPVSLSGKASLRRIFEDDTLKEIGGTIINKLSILKLLLAIAQRACTPIDKQEWKELGYRGLGQKCILYLNHHFDSFFLYGDKPFLQFPKLANPIMGGKKILQPREIGTSFLPDLLSENNTILNQYQRSIKLSDAEKALFIVSIMNYSPGGKRVDKESPIFSDGFTTKKGSGKASPSIGNYVGYLQSCFWGCSILETVWLNLLTQEDFSSMPQYAGKEFIPPWEKMPEGEDDETARKIKDGFMGTLCSLSRFVLLKDDGIIYTDGIPYPSHKEGWREPFMSYSQDEKVDWINPEKKPWRNLNAILEFAFINSANMNCPQISCLFRRNRNATKRLGIISGGLKVRATSGDQSVKQTDDFVEDCVFLNTSILNQEWYQALKREMQGLDLLARNLYLSVRNYFNGYSSKEDIAKQAVEQFWDDCGRFKYEIFSRVKEGEELVSQRKMFAGFAMNTYSDKCPKETANQILNWAKCKPSFSKYLSLKEEEKDNV